MIKLSLDEKYKELVDNIVSVKNPNWSYFFDNYSKAICDLAEKWFCDESYRSKVKVIERIHSTDEIEWIERKYNWRLKSEKVFNRYVWVDCDGLNFCSADCADSDDVMTELEFKKLLEGTGLPFEAFERVDINEEEWLFKDCELMQYAGLDDINGKPIYENDIVEFELGLIHTKAEVVYSRSQFTVNMNSVMSRSLGAYSVKVIGNKFQNLELLEEY